MSQPHPSAAFKQRLRAAFAAVSVGQEFSFRRTFTEADLSLFCGVTGDFNPYHLDAQFAAESRFGKRIVPGLLTGSMITHLGGLIGFLATEMTFQFLVPVYPGDTITCTMRILEKDEEQRTLLGDARLVNQDDAEVVHATFKGFPSDVRLAR